MKFRTAARIGVPVSEIGLGCWQIGSAGWDAVGDESAREILRISVEQGVTLIDTADVYGAGHSETRIGQFLKTLPEAKAKGIFVASKLGRLKGYPDSYSYELLRECTLATLERLGRAQLDLQQLHCVPHKVLQAGHVFDWLRKLQSEGLIKHFGASVESMEEARTCLAHPDLAALQIIFNIFRQKPIEELFNTAKEKGVALIVRLPLASGLLAGKYTAGTTFSAADHRNFNRNGEHFNVGETFAGLPFEKAVELTQQLKPLMGVGADSATPVDGAGVSMADLSMRWILDHDAVTTVIPGASRPAQAMANTHATDLPPLPGAMHQALRNFYTSTVNSHIRGPY